MRDVVIIGAGGAGREACWAFQESRKWKVIGFVDDNPELQGTAFCDQPVLGGFSWLERERRKSFAVLCAIGNPNVRRSVVERAAGLGLEFCTVVHPSVNLSRWVEIGPGSIVCAGSTVTTQVKIGAHVTVNVGCSVSHDAVIGDYCNINPGCRIAGAVTVGEGVDLGMGAMVIQNRKIGEWSVIGAGAVVTKDVPAYVTAVGVPCRVIKVRQAELVGATE
jgi:sugar O-acyltransferase (sialic acid O-acetyltransferase NeuD family)